MEFAAKDVLKACSVWGNDLKYIPAGIEPVRLMWAFANKESTHERKGYLGCEPRFEPAYYVGGKYADSPTQANLNRLFGQDGAKSYGPWQVMLVNALKWRPEDFRYLDICAEAFIEFLNCRTAPGHPQPKTIEEFGQLYNGGHVGANPAQVQEYCYHLNEWYKLGLPADRGTTTPPVGAQTT